MVEIPTAIAFLRGNMETNAIGQMDSTGVTLQTFVNVSTYEGVDNSDVPPNITYLIPVTDYHLPTLRIVCDIALSLPIALLGIVGNVLAFIVLCHNKHKLTTNVLLQALAVTDTLVLVSTVLLRCLRFIAPAAYLKAYSVIFVALYPCVFYFRLVDTWLTVLLTIDRFIAVCYPMHAQRLCTLRRTYCAMAALLVSALIFTIPRFFEYRYVYVESRREHHYTSTPLAFNHVYVIGYKILLFFLVMYYIPMALLIVLNTRLVRALRRANTYREIAMRTTGEENRQQVLEMGARINRSITIIVVTVVLVCIACNLGAMTVHVIYCLHKAFGLMQLEVVRRYLANISNLMVTINCAINFAIYCVCSRNFRTLFANTFHCNREGTQSTTHTSVNKRCSNTDSTSAYSTNVFLRTPFRKTSTNTPECKTNGETSV